MLMNECIEDLFEGELVNLTPRHLSMLAWAITKMNFQNKSYINSLVIMTERVSSFCDEILKAHKYKGEEPEIRQKRKMTPIEELENIGAQDLEGDKYTPEELFEIVNPHTLSNLYWCLAKLGVSANHKIFLRLERVIKDYIVVFA